MINVFHIRGGNLGDLDGNLYCTALCLDLENVGKRKNSFSSVLIKPKDMRLPLLKCPLICDS